MNNRSTPNHNHTQKLIQGSKEWFAARSRIPCTASNAGSVFGLSPWSSPADVASTFDGTNPFTGNAACRYGSYSEDVAIEKVEKTLNLKIDETGLWLNNDFNLENFFVYPFSTSETEKKQKLTFIQEGIAGSPDGLIYYKSPKRNKDGFNNQIEKIIEVKCTHSAYHAKFIKKTPWYMHQCQLNSLIVNVKSCLFISFTPFSCGVWELPRVDTIPISRFDLLEYEIAQNEPHCEFFIELGLYDEKAQRFVGYKRIFMNVLYEFYCNCQKPLEKRQDWEKWSYEHHRYTRIINKLHAFAFDHSKELFLHTEDKRSTLGIVKKCNWTSLLSWQIKYFEENEVENAVIERFGFVSENFKTPIFMNGTDQKQRIIHIKQLFPETKIPFPSEGKHAFLDLYTYSKSKLKRKCLEINLKTFPVQVSYGKWERKKELPKGGLCLMTVQDGQQYTHWYAGAWEPLYKGTTGHYEAVLGPCTVTFNDQYILDFKV